jgi:3-oxoacyl-(acyl-carrier-protein) synthase
MILSEGAGAIVVARKGGVAIERTHAGGRFPTRAEAWRTLQQIISDLSESEAELIISSANGTFVDEAESRVLEQVAPRSLVYTAKPALGESVGAAGLWQVIVAAEALRSREVPAVLHTNHATTLRLALARTSIASTRRVIVLSCGLNQQAAGLRLSVR